MDGKLKTQLDAFLYRYTPHVLSVKLSAQYLILQLKPECFFKLYFTSNGHAKTIISRRACVIIWCPECWRNGISKPSDFKIFWGSMPPDPPRLMGLTAPCSYSRFFFFNQLPTSNFIETPELVTF